MIKERILTVRGQRVIVDADIASLYGVKTKRKLKFSSILPLVFTEHGLKRRLDRLEQRVTRGFHDNEDELQAICFAIQQLMEVPTTTSRKPIGFGRKG